MLDARSVLRGSNRRLSTANFEEIKLAAADAAADDQFGISVAIDGDTVVIGAPGAGTGGAVYAFRTTDDGATYDEVAKLTATDAAVYDKFGTSVAVDGGTIVVGAQGDDEAASGSGSVYVFRTTDGGATYGQVAKLTAADAAYAAYFGASVAIDGDTTVVGAYGDDDGSSSTNHDSGAAYIFSSDSSWWGLLFVGCGDAAAPPGHGPPRRHACFVDCTNRGEGLGVHG